MSPYWTQFIKFHEKSSSVYYFVDQKANQALRQWLPTFLTLCPFNTALHAGVMPSHKVISVATVLSHNVNIWFARHVNPVKESFSPPTPRGPNPQAEKHCSTRVKRHAQLYLVPVAVRVRPGLLVQAPPVTHSAWTAPPSLSSPIGLACLHLFKTQDCCSLPTCFCSPGQDNSCHF